MNLHINLLSVNERMNCTYVKLVKGDFTENRWSKRQSGIKNLCEVILKHRFSQMYLTENPGVRNNRSNNNQIKASRTCRNRLWTVFYLCMMESSLGCNLIKTQPVVQFDEEKFKTFFRCLGVDSRMKDKGRGYGGRHIEVCCSFQYRRNTNIVKAANSLSLAVNWYWLVTNAFMQGEWGCFRE